MEIGFHILCIWKSRNFVLCNFVFINENKWYPPKISPGVIFRKKINRGGVEDTRLEAKETKKIRGQGQGQPFRGQTLSRPRTGMLEAKDTSASALQKKKKKKIFTKIFQAISTKKRFPKNFSSASQNFNNSKNTAVLEPRTGQFSRTWGFEAKAKDLTFEAKAKDFKICPRGQGRPRGLHLWKLIYNPVLFSGKHGSRRKSEPWRKNLSWMDESVYCRTNEPWRKERQNYWFQVDL